jgi:hypothetical protein
MHIPLLGEEDGFEGRRTGMICDPHRTLPSKKMFPFFEKAPESLPVPSGSGNPREPFLEFFRPGGDGKPQIMERLGADPAE